MPVDYAKYPANWSEIVQHVRVRADGRCECEGECGLHCTHPGPRRCEERHGEPAKWAKGKVVLTTAHLCHEQGCSDESHMKSMCQRCHLRYDSALHAGHAAETRRRKRIDRGQTELPAVAVPA